MLFYLFCVFLFNLRKHVELQAKLADAFLCKYQLRPDEVKALRASKDSVMKEVRLPCCFKVTLR